MFHSRETRSLDIRHSDVVDNTLRSRRSVDACKSCRRYDERWGTAELSDTRLRCADGVIHHVHSQILCLWSPVLQDMIASYPTPQLLESTHGLAYLLHVDEHSQEWTAVLDCMYPVATQPLDWDMLERCLLLADKYDMRCLVQHFSSRISSSICSSTRNFSMEPTQANFAVKWLLLAERLQMQEVQHKVLAYLRQAVCDLASQPNRLTAVLSYAQEHLSKQQLALLLQMALEAASSQQEQLQQQPMPLVLAPMQHTPLQQYQTGFDVRQQRHPQQEASANFGWDGCNDHQLGPACGYAGHNIVKLSQAGLLMPVLNLQLYDALLSAAQVSSSILSMSSASTPAGSSAVVDIEDVSSSAQAPRNLQATDTPLHMYDTTSCQHAAGLDQHVEQQLCAEQQRLAMCLSSVLYASSNPSCGAAEPELDMAPQGSSPQVCTATIVPTARATVAQQSRLHSCSLPTESVATTTEDSDNNSSGFAGFESFGRAAYAGSLSIADWMDSSLEALQPEFMMS